MPFDEIDAFAAEAAGFGNGYFARLNQPRAERGGRWFGLPVSTLPRFRYPPLGLTNSRINLTHEGWQTRKCGALPRPVLVYPSTTTVSSPIPCQRRRKTRGLEVSWTTSPTSIAMWSVGSSSTRMVDAHGLCGNGGSTLTITGESTRSTLSGCCTAGWFSKNLTPSA